MSRFRCLSRLRCPGILAWGEGMTRRLARFAVRGLCSLSLLACALASWLSWHSGRVCFDELQVGVGGTLCVLISDEQGVSLRVVRHWPGPFGVRAHSVATHQALVDRRAFWLWPTDGLIRTLTGMERWYTRDARSGHARLLGTVKGDAWSGHWTELSRVEMGSRPSATDPHWSEPLPYWTTAPMRHAWLIAPTALPPLGWLVLLR